VKEPLDVALEHVSDLLSRAADSQQTSTYCTSTATSKPLDVLQYAAVFQCLCTSIHIIFNDQSLKHSSLSYPAFGINFNPHSQVIQ